MSAHAMISGRIMGDIKVRDTKNGNKVAFFRLKVQRIGGAEYWDVATFDKDSLAELDDIPDGVPICAIGEFSIEPWEKDGKRGFNLKLTAHTVTRLRQKKRRRGLADPGSRSFIV